MYKILWLVILTVLIVAVVGYCLNFMAVWNAAAITGFVLIRVIGIFVVPLGAILGFV